MARNCPTCGRANDDDARFCQGCGAAVAPADPPPAGPGTPPASPGKPSRDTPTWLIFAIVAAAIALVGAMALVLLSRDETRAGGGSSPTPMASMSVVISPTPAFGQYLAGAVGPHADRLATIAADGSVEPVARFDGDDIRQIAYSPDGKWLACVAGTYRRSELWLFDTVTGDALQPTAGTPTVVAVDSIAWLSPRELLVAGYTETPKATGQTAGFMIYDQPAGTFRPLLDGGGMPLRGVSVSASRDGATVAFVTYTDVKDGRNEMVTATERLEVLDRRSGAVTELGTNEALFDVNARAFDDPLISPSGDAIIYRRAGSDVGTSYTVVGTDGTTLMPAKEALMPAGYAWDPEGTRVVFTGHPIKSGTDTGTAIFWQFDTEAGGAPTEIARYQNADVQDLSWSPDGATIAWAGYDRKKEWRTGRLYLMPASGGDSVVFVEEALSPVWAPGTAESLQTSPNPEQ
jgi:WD40 repeat protein